MIRQDRLGEVFVELADTLVADFDVVEFLTMLAHRTAELLNAAEAGVVIADEAGHLRSVAASTEAARLLELFELQNQEGPCLDCFRTGGALVNQSLAVDDQWPVFSPEARRRGFRLVHALPMRLRGHTVGAINIFSKDDVALADADIALAQAMADVATIGLIQERGLREARLLNEQLQAALQSRVVIEQAKGMLSERRAIDMEDAFELLRAHARSTNQKLAQVASALLEGTLDVESLG